MYVKSCYQSLNADLTEICMVMTEKTRVLYLSCVLLIMALVTTISGQTRPASSPNGVEIHVQIVDSHSHRPLKGRKVQVDWLDTHGKWHPLIGHTAADGFVTFPIKEPIPPSIAVQDFWAYNCATEVFSTQEVLDHGIVSVWPHTASKKANKWCTADRNAPEPHPTPGEITFFVHPMNRVEYAWYSLWK